MSAEAFIRAHTTIARPALVPEIRLHLADAITPIWQASEAWLEAHGLAPPFWAFAWPGGQALARLCLDRPGLVAGQRVLDFAAGSGLGAIAALRAGAASALAAEIDPVGAAACRLNARLNGVAPDVTGEDLIGCDRGWQTVLAGDICYEAPMSARVLPWLRALAARGAAVWLADPGRAYLPREGLAGLVCYRVPTSRELEDHTHRDVTIFRLLG